jgi:hypothetical protein
MIHIKLDYKIILQCIFNFFQCTDVREVNLVYPIHNGSYIFAPPSARRNFLVFLLEEIGSDRAHCECMRRFAIFGTTHVIHCIITNFACLSGNKLTNWCLRNYKDIIHIKFDYKIILQCIFNCFQCTDVREVNLVYPIHNGSCTHL